MGLAEQMVGIKAKTFLMSTVFDLAKKYSFLSTKWNEVTFEIIRNAMKSFAPDEKRLEDHSQKFLQWLGFTPVDLGWDQERRVLNIYIGTSRIWREDPKTDQVANVVMKALIASIGANFFGGNLPQVEFLEENLPPRTQFGFRITEGLGDDSISYDMDMTSSSKETESGSESTSGEDSTSQTNEPKKASGSSKIKAINRIKMVLDPVFGSGIDKDGATKHLYNATIKILEENYPNEYKSVINDIGSYNVLQILFKQSQSNGKEEELSLKLGEDFSALLEYPDIESNDAVSGIGKMDPNTIDELLYYTKEKHIDEGFCKFVSNVWLGYINKFMPSEFKSDEPMCKITGAGMCLYAYNPK